MKPYSKKQTEILEYVSKNGQVEVELGPREIKQNKNFYGRVFRLESDGLLVVNRRDGEKSLYTITNLGYQILTEKLNEKRRTV